MGYANLVLYPVGQQDKQQAETTGIGMGWAGWTFGEWKVEEIPDSVEGAAIGYQK